jgi:cell wall-associated NlpC family hydrolase
MKFPLRRSLFIPALRPVAVLSAVIVFSLTGFAQEGEGRQRRAATTTVIDGSSRLENELAPAPLVNVPPAKLISEFASPRMLRFNSLLHTAIEERMGTPYSFGATGPYAFDCSGFVWSAFQEVGISFERGSARTLWARFAPATGAEESKFGTLVFFNGLNHIGIVADENGFYHASTSRGVVYSRFNDYWLDRIDGFRRIPMATETLGE